MRTIQPPVRLHTTASPFFGYGGLSHAVNTLFGSRTVWACDNEPGPSLLLAHRYPDVPNLDDITRIDFDTVPASDVWDGGSPCTDISSAGRMAGMVDGTRSNLWVNMREGIRVTRPKIVCWENVRGATTAKAASASDTGSPVNLRALGRVTGDLASLGYRSAFMLLKASDVGACHQRARMFLIGWDAAVIDDEAARSGVDEVLPAGSRRRPVIESAPVAVWDRAADVWRDPAGRVFAQKFPDHGVVVDGVLFGRESWRTQSADGALLLATPRAAEWKGCGPRGSASQQYRLARHYLDAQVLDLDDPVDDVGVLLPTPRVGADRTSRAAALDPRRRSSPSLAQAVEIADGTLPREFDTGDPLPGSWLPTPRAAERGQHSSADMSKALSAVTVEDLPCPADLMPTPRASEAQHSGRNLTPGATQVGVAETVNSLLPTPAASTYGSNKSLSPGAQVRPSVEVIVSRLLPTPSVADGSGGHVTRGGNRSGELLLPGIVTRLLPNPSTTPSTPVDTGGLVQDWGKYTAAIRRQEHVTGLPAPIPTEPNRRGDGRRMQPGFPEWMMMLGGGWITGVPRVTRVMALKMAGNGVVPLQAWTAYRFLIDQCQIGVQVDDPMVPDTMGS